MRWFQAIALGLALVACGGTAARTPKNSPEVGGGAGEPSGGLGAAPSEGAAAGAGTGGMGGVAGSTEAQVAGAAGLAASAAGGEAGADGAPPESCVGVLDCLAGEELIYAPDREWQRPAAAATVNGELSEADYQPRLGPTWRAKFSNDAQALDLTPTAGGDTVHGTRDPNRTDRLWFELVLFAGGRFVIQTNENGLQAEYTAYGSGSPVVSSTRGLLKRP